MSDSTVSPTVTIVTVNWRGLDDTLACLESLTRMTYASYNVLLVDNGSDDGSPEAIAARFPDMPLICSDTNLGFAGGFNLGITEALDRGADQIFILNNDTIVVKDALDWLVQALVTAPDVGVAVPKITYYDDADLLWAAGARWRAVPPGVKMRGYRRPAGAARFNVPAEVTFVTGCALLVSRRVFETVGFFDPQYFMYQEDYDFSVRVARAGIKMRYEPRALVRHRVSQGLGENSARKWMLWGRSLAIFYLKHYSPTRLRAFVAWVVLRELLKGNAGSLKPLMRGVAEGRRLMLRGGEASV